MADRKRRLQLRTRVLAGVLSVTLVALVAFDIAAVSALRRYLLNQTDARLQTVLHLYRPQAVPAQVKALRAPLRLKQIHGVGPGEFTAKASARFTIIGPRVIVPSPLGQYYVGVLSGSGPKTFVAGPPFLKPRVPPNFSWTIIGERAQTVASINGRAPLRLTALSTPGGIVIVTTSLASVDRTVNQVRLILIIGSAIAGLLVALGVVLIVRRGLRPIETMAAQADRITAGDLADRVSAQDPQTEVGRLGAALNGMLARIEASVQEREASQLLTRQFFADASHELRNPLASLRANAELYQQGALRDRSQVDEAMRRIGLEAQRMSGLVDDMLRLARLDQHPDRQRDPVELSALVEECIERTRIADPVRIWQASVAPGLVAVGDEDLLRRAVDNLLANVRTHTPAETVATVTAARNNGAITVKVSDDGPGVPADQLSRVFDRFYRGELPSRRPGSGLGLAIVSAVAVAHDGTAEAALNSPHGLSVSITLPARGEEPRPRDTALESATASSA